MGEQLFRPAVVEDDVNEVIADERLVEMFEYVGVDVSERGSWPVHIAFGERPQYPPFEIGTRMRCGDRLYRRGRQMVAADAQDVCFDTSGVQGDFRFEESRYAGGG